MTHTRRRPALRLDTNIQRLRRHGEARLSAPIEGFLCSAPWLLLVYLAQRAGWQPQDIATVVAMLIPVMAISTRQRQKQA